MSEIIAPGNTATTFATGEFTIAAGGTATLYIKGSAGISSVTPTGNYELAHKTSAGDYITLLSLNSSNINDKGMVVGLGTFAVRRLIGNSSSGMDIQQ